MFFYSISKDVSPYKMLANHAIVLDIIQLQKNRWTKGKKNTYFVKRQKDR